MCAIQHYQGYEMVDFETKFDYTQGFMGDYQNGKVGQREFLPTPQ